MKDILVILIPIHGINKQKSIDVITLYKLSSKRRSGPVTPIINSGCPLTTEKTIPAIEDPTNVSEIPIWFSVFSAKNHKHE